MSTRGPEFDELVGSDLEPIERQRLLAVHELLVAAGPPPDLATGAAAPETTQRVLRLPHRRRGALVALAAAFGILLFAVGYVVGDGRNEPGTFDSVAMSGTPQAQQATATLTLFDVDEAGNWPMEISVSGLMPLASGKPYELWLTRSGKLSALCGTFRVQPDGTAVVPMNAPYRLNEFDGWVVVEEGTTAPLLTT